MPVQTSENDEDDSEELAKARQALLAYLEARLGHQIDYFRQVDTKTNVRLLVCVGLVVFLVQLLPIIPRLQHLFADDSRCGVASGAGTLLVISTLNLAAFVATLARTLWLALDAIEVQVAFPSADRSLFENAANNPKLRLEKAVSELTVNCAKAVEANALIIHQRQLKGDVLVRWSRITLVVSVVLVALLGADASFIAWATGGSKMAGGEKTQEGVKTPAENPGTPTPELPGAGGNTSGSSLGGDPKVISFGRMEPSAPPSLDGNPTVTGFAKANTGIGQPLTPTVTGEPEIHHFGEADHPIPTPRIREGGGSN